MNRTNDNILDHDDDALLSEKHIRPFEFFKNLSESDSIRTCLVTDTHMYHVYFLSTLFLVVVVCVCVCVQS